MSAQHTHTQCHCPHRASVPIDAAADDSNSQSAGAVSGTEPRRNAPVGRTTAPSNSPSRKLSQRERTHPATEKSKMRERPSADQCETQQKNTIDSNDTSFKLSSAFIYVLRFGRN